ncbi:MAG: transposase [Gammaproteobacteria bacterium]|nr:transposase [Gammaproteobacteria bacterium]
MPLARMLRVCVLQQGVNLSEPAVEAALYDSAAMRRFAGIDPGREAAPEETSPRVQPVTARRRTS